MTTKKFLRFFLIGGLFGLVLAKAQIVSWFKIYEMFLFQSFHMYGVIGSAVFLGMICVYIIKKKKWKNAYGHVLIFSQKKRTVFRYLIGGAIFGMGWALTGACPGPMYILLGYGYSAFIVVILSAILGTFVYGLVKDKLPH